MARKLKAVEATVVKGKPPVNVQINENGDDVIVEDEPVVQADENLDGDFLPIPSNLEELIEQSSKPPLAEGTYLGAITSVKGHLNPETLSYGYKWEVLVNGSPFEDGWDGEGKTFTVKQYTYVGKMVNGKLTQTNGGFSATNFLASLGISGALNTEAVRGKQLIVQIKHRQDQNDDTRYFMEIARTFAYTKDDVKAPVLQIVKDSKPEVVAQKPANDNPDW